MHHDETAPRPRGLLNRKFFLVTLAVTAVILHGSLYPYDFHVPAGSAGPLDALLHSLNRPRDSFGEMIANILLYIPFGFFAVLTIRSRWRLAVVTVLGVVLCTSIELAQFYDTDRVTSLVDVALNTSGTVLGALTAVIVRIPSLSPLFRTTVARPVPFILLAAMLGYHLYPYVPTIDLHKYWNSVKPLVLHPAFNQLDTFRYFALWLTIAFLTRDAVARARSWFFVLFLAAFVFGAKMLIVNQSISLSEVAGASAAIVLWLAVLERVGAAAAVVALVLCAMIVVFRLAPFEFQAQAAPFGWLPFRGFLNGSFGVNVQSFFEKAFLYGSLVWIAGRAGLKLPVATVAVAAFVLATSVAQTYLPGRSAEITDAIITIMMGAIFIAMSGSRVSELATGSPLHRRSS